MKIIKTFERTIEVCDVKGCETQVYYPKYYEDQVYCRKHLKEIVAKKHNLHFWRYEPLCRNNEVYIIRKCMFSFCNCREELNISKLTNFKYNSISMILEAIYCDKRILSKITEWLGGNNNE